MEKVSIVQVGPIKDAFREEETLWSEVDLGMKAFLEKRKPVFQAK